MYEKQPKEKSPVPKPNLEGPAKGGAEKKELRTMDFNAGEKALQPGANEKGPIQASIIGPIQDDRDGWCSFVINRGSESQTSVTKGDQVDVGPYTGKVSEVYAFRAKVIVKVDDNPLPTASTVTVHQGQKAYIDKRDADRKATSDANRKADQDSEYDSRRGR